MARDLLAETKYLIKTNNLKLGQIAGQRFLVSEDVLNKIIATAAIKKNDLILEIGPGLGILTTELVKRAQKVLAVEYDKKLIPALNKIRQLNNNLEIVNDDILRVKNQEIVDSLGSGYRIVANIPYQITSKIINKFLAFEPKPKDLILLMQKEVAERITAGPGSLSKLAISVQFYAKPQIIDIVSKDCFWPVPKVDSALIKINLHNKYINILNKEKLSEKQFWSVVRAGFAAKRKTLVNNLSNSLHLDKLTMSNVLAGLKLDKKVRAQELSIEQWIRLAVMIKSRCQNPNVNLSSND